MIILFYGFIVFNMHGPYNFISVIVPCLNSESTIRKCITSLLDQEYPKGSYEIILVDNGSDDKTVEIIKQYPVKLIQEYSKNPYIARNTGANYSTGKILAFIDSNCEADICWLSSINGYVSKGIEVSQGPGHLTKQEDLLPRAESNRIKMTEDAFWGDGKNIAMLKSIFIEVGGFPTYFTGSDSLMLHKLQVLRYNVKFNEKQKVYREFSTKFFVLIKKHWKYGKGDIANDLFKNQLNRKKKMVLCVKHLLRIFIRIPKYRSFEDYFINNFYNNSVKIARYVSYIVNYRYVLKKCQDIDNF